MKTKLLIVIAVALLGSSCAKGYPAMTNINNSSSSSDYNTLLTVAGKQLHVSVANTDAARKQGLSDRASLDEDQGMLFDFRNTPTIRPTFWMKDMNFDLDFVWINGNRVIDLTENAPSQKKLQVALGQLPLYSPKSDANLVLEVNAGWIKSHGIKIGDEVKF